jgi:hypothetical protein
MGGIVIASAAAARTPCLGPPLAPGAVIHGPVLDIPDGATLCIATGSSPSQWTEIAVPQLKASRALLMAAAFGQNATCTMGPAGVADCTIEGASLASELKRPQVIKASGQWRARAAEETGPVQLASSRR